MRRVLSVFAIAVAVVACLAAVPSFADDSEGALSDGGSIVTSTDGGRNAVAQLRAGQNWTMATRCEGAQSTRYTLCTSSSCTASASSQLLDYDITQDIGVNRPPFAASPKTHIALYTDDGGVPRCLVHINR